MADDQEVQAGPEGSGPLYERGEAGKAAADRPVKIPGKDPESAGAGKPTGESEAAANRENDPPA